MKEKIRIMAIAIVLMLVQSVKAQDNAFASGENIKMTISYTLGFIEVRAAQANITANCCIYDGEDAMNLELAGKTIKAFKAFNIRDTLRAKVDPYTLMPKFTQVQSHEDDYFASYQTTYGTKDGKNYARVRKYKRDGLRKDTTIYSDKMYLDVMSILFQLRNVDFSKLTKNQRTPMPAIFQDDLFDLYWRYAGKEKITIRKGETYNCVKVCPCFVEGTLFDKGEVMTIWLTDDKNHMPVLIESKLKIGSIRVVMESVKGNKYPFTSLIAN